MWSGCVCFYTRHNSADSHDDTPSLGLPGGRAAVLALFGFAVYWWWLQDCTLMILTLKHEQLLKTGSCVWVMGKQDERMPRGTHNVFQIKFAVNEARSSVFWWGTAWLLEWSEQSINQYDCSRRLLKRHRGTCVQRDWCSSVRAALEGILIAVPRPWNQNISSNKWKYWGGKKKRRLRR